MNKRSARVPCPETGWDAHGHRFCVSCAVLLARCLTWLSEPQAQRTAVRGKAVAFCPSSVSLHPSLPGPCADTTSMAPGSSLGERGHKRYPDCPEKQRGHEEAMQAGHYLQKASGLPSPPCSVPRNTPRQSFHLPLGEGPGSLVCWGHGHCGHRELWNLEQNSILLKEEKMTGADSDKKSKGRRSLWF